MPASDADADADAVARQSSRRLALARRLAQALWPSGHAQGVEVRPMPEGAVMARAVLSRPEGRPAVLHLPAAVLTSDALTLASTAHAVSHVVFGAPAQSRRGLKPVQQALLGVLEDARVEYLALEQLPGLRRWWSAWLAEAGASRGQSFEDLLARLTWVLHDPVRNHDPHPWIRKVRDLFFEPDGRLALRDAQDLRQVASRLGHDIGQMRLPFNARTYGVAGAYRDDNTCLWLPDDEDRAAEDPLFEGEDEDADSASPPEPTLLADALPESVTATWYPEWDQRIRRLRPRWCRVLTEDMTEGLAETLDDASSQTENHAQSRAVAQQSRRLGRWLQAMQPRHAGRGPRSTEGDELHPVAMVDHVVARRHRSRPDSRVFHAPVRRPLDMGVLLVVDASASAQHRVGEWQRQAWAVAGALMTLGCRVAVWRFGSDGRQAVRVQVLKHWDRTRAHGQGLNPAMMPPPPPAMLGSTRVGPVVRHAVAECAQMARRRLMATWRVVVLSDGDWHDTDVHEAGYLDADLARAVEDAHGLGVQVHFPVAQADWLALHPRSRTRRMATPVRAALWSETVVRLLRV